MAESKLVMNRTNSNSPPPNCAICLGAFTNKCFLNSCMHEFCFKCLLEWSKIKPECPLCKQQFKSIIHNVKPNNEYDEHIVENVSVEANPFIDATAPFLYLPPTPPPLQHHQFHFRTTLTVDTRGEHAIQQFLLSHPLTTTNRYQLTSGFVPNSRFGHRRRRETASSSNLRRTIYNQNLWVCAPPDITGRYRDVSPQYYRNNPSARTRLVPWLNRELNALLYESTQHVMHLVDVIMDHLTRYHICSSTFRRLLSDYLGNKTDHFIHEFYNFMRSPFDMIGYDRHVIYSDRPNSPIPLIDLSDYDSDVIIVSTSSNNNENPIVIDLVNTTDSDEPIIAESTTTNNENNNPSNTNINNIEHRSSPILPIKLKLKNQHRLKYNNNRKRYHRQRSSSSSSSTSSSSTSSTSSSDSFIENRKHRHKKRSKKYRNITKRMHRRRFSTTTSSSSGDSDSKKYLNLFKKEKDDDDDNIPLSNYTNKKKSMRKKLKLNSRIKNEFHNDVLNKGKLQLIDDKQKNSSCKMINNNNNEGSDIKDFSCLSLPSPVSSVEQTTNTHNTNINGGESSDDYAINLSVKSEIREVKNNDEKQCPGPSTGNLRHVLKKQDSNNLWYSRPRVCNDSDSSD